MRKHAEKHCCAVGSASAKQLLTMCWSLAVLEQTESEMFQIPWRALLQKQQEDIGLDLRAASSYCQVCHYLIQSVIYATCPPAKHFSILQATCFWKGSIVSAGSRRATTARPARDTE